MLTSEQRFREHTMGIGRREDTAVTAKDWNNGSCDIMAVALHRLTGFLLQAEFEQGMDNGQLQLGYLIHAWVCLPDGQALDASGMFSLPVSNPNFRDPHDDWVQGTTVITINENDPWLLESRETSTEDYTSDIEG
jgi:hypothetical protein